MIYLSILFILLTFIVISFVMLFTTLRGVLRAIINVALKRSGEPCPFCHNDHSMVNRQTETGYRKVCKRCGFAIAVDDVEHFKNTNTSDESSNHFTDENDNNSISDHNNDKL